MRPTTAPNLALLTTLLGLPGAVVVVPAGAFASVGTPKTTTATAPPRRGGPKEPAFVKPTFSVLRAVRQLNGDGLTFGRLRRATGLPADRVRRAVAKLQASGKLKKVGRGRASRYRATPRAGG